MESAAANPDDQTPEVSFPEETAAGSPPPAEPPAEGPETDAQDTPAVVESLGDATAQDGTAPGDNIIAYDFRHPSLLTPSENRKLQLRHTNFARSLSTRFSIYLRLEIAFEIKEFNTLSFSQLIQSLPNPTHYTFFKIEPLQGIGLWEMPTALGLRISDRLLGGPGINTKSETTLTEIDMALLDQATQIALKEWSEHVARQTELKPVFLGHETNGRYLQIASNDAHMLVLTLEVTLDDKKDLVHLAFPHEMLEPMLRQLGPVVEARKNFESAKFASPTWNPELGHVQLPIEAQWTGLEMTTRHLAQLKVGDVVPVSASHGEEVRVYFAKVPKFTGRLGKCGRHWAIQLTSAVKP